MELIESSHCMCTYKKRERGGINEMESLEQRGSEWQPSDAGGDQ